MRLHRSLISCLPRLWCPDCYRCIVTDCYIYMYRYSRRELYNIIADMSSYPRFVPFCSSTRTLRTSASTSSSAQSSSSHTSPSSSQSHQPLSKSLAEHLAKPSLDLLISKEVLELDVEMTAKFLIHEESYVSVVTCRPFESVTVRYSSAHISRFLPRLEAL